ncbi:putative acyltransferase [Polychytrium aggregatum]|uniref:putative acyltransferase n=1 Tax=Polychytrium aggregatum TaxID=110093 RepID=UPI0022FDBA67|nr:putative acyltransferase [Polychytrium aggregatum]KAI9205226.1 putative acyltransferase [Polychytrium aggregatum]
MFMQYAAEIKSSLLASPKLQKSIQSFALARYNLETDHKLNFEDMEKEYYAKASQIIDKLIANMTSITTVRFIAFMTGNMLMRLYHQGIHIRESEWRMLQETAKLAEKKGLSLIVLPCHKSHIDYLVISYVFYRFGLALPHIAAGDNLDLPVIGPLLRSAGAFFIRRKWNDDALYTTIMREYIELLLLRGYNIEVFIEGTRSRIGKLLQPKLGILKIIMDAVMNRRVRDCLIVPMSIGYDKVIETESYVHELLGREKEKESLYQLFSSANVLNLKWGRVDIRFSQIFSLREYIEEQIKSRGDTFDPVNQSKDHDVLLQALGFRVLSDINSVSVVMPTALVGTVILTLRGRGVGRDELIRKVDWLRNEIASKGGNVADFGGMTTGMIVDRAIHDLKHLIGHRMDLLEPVFFPLKRFELSLYRNQVIHLFVPEAIVATSIYTKIKYGGPIVQQRLPYHPTLFEEASFLSHLLKGEFIYGPSGMDKNLDAAVRSLHDAKVISIEEDPGDIYGVPSSYESTRLHKTVWVSLSSEERKKGRETFDFFCFLLWPFIEAYWLAAVSLFVIVPDTLPRSRSHDAEIPPEDRLDESCWVEEKEFLDRAQAFGKTLYFEGDISYFESVNKETIKNAITRLMEMGVLLCRKFIPVPGSSSEDNELPRPMELPSVEPTVRPNQPKTPKPALPSVKSYLAVHPNWLPPENLPPVRLGSSEQHLESVHDQWVRHKPAGKLWELCEHISTFRREGKNRRDTETVSMRVLRLARIAAQAIKSGRTADMGSGASTGGQRKPGVGGSESSPVEEAGQVDGAAGRATKHERSKL